jgi:uncharacterized damage-inducible protein DinB
MDADYFRLMFGYNKWANERLLGKAVELTDEEFVRPMGLSMQSVRGALAHQMAIEVNWLGRLNGEGPAFSVSQDDFASGKAMAERWSEHDEKLMAYMAGLTDDDVNATFTYKNPRGEEASQVRGIVLTHVVNHGTQFRSEAGVGLSQLGHSPGDIDFPVFLRETGR